VVLPRPDLPVHQDEAVAELRRQRAGALQVGEDQGLLGGVRLAGLGARPVGGERAVVRLDEVGAAGGREHPDPDLRLVRPEVQDQVVQLARERERPERDAERVKRREVGGRGGPRPGSR